MELTEAKHDAEWYRQAGRGYAVFSAPLLRYGIRPGMTRSDMFSDRDLNDFAMLLLGRDLASWSPAERDAAMASWRDGFDQVVIEICPAPTLPPEAHAPAR